MLITIFYLIYLIGFSVFSVFSVVRRFILGSLPYRERPFSTVRAVVRERRELAEPSWLAAAALATDSARVRTSRPRILSPFRSRRATSRIVSPGPRIFPLPLVSTQEALDR